MDFDITFKFILVFIIGALIGLEREVNEKKDTPLGTKNSAVLGIRTFSLTSILGAIVGVLFANFPSLALIIASAFFILTTAFYILDSISTKDYGITTEIALIFSFILGVIILLGVLPIQLTLAISVCLIFLLSKKKSIKNVMDDVRRTEVNAFISFGIIALVILPFLPNQSYALSDIPHFSNFIKNFGLNFDQIINLELVNPFKLWMIVALITGVDFAGYVLERTFGQKKGWLLASIAGGFISSTATTQTLAQESKKSKSANHLVAAAIIANLVSFIQIAIIVGSQNMTFLTRLLPTLVAMVWAALVLSVFFLRMKREKARKEKNNGVKAKEIINLNSALKFAGLYILISLISKIALALFGSGGFLVTTALGAIVGLDAVMINTAQIVEKSIDSKVGIIAFILANFVNLTSKSIYSFIQGKKEFAVKFTISMGIIVFSSLSGLFF